MIARLTLAALLAATSVQAAQTPQSGPADPRIGRIDYDPWQVVRLRATPGAATQVLFGPGETILHVALGDSAGWEVAAEGQSLFLKPKSPAAAGNMIVTTRAATQTRHYTFQLITSRKAAPGGLYMLRFVYPDDEKRALTLALQAQTQIAEQRLAGLKLEQAVLQGPRNLAYAAQGSSALQPSEVSDNGAYTILRFPGRQPVPAIYQVNADGVESLAAFDVRGEFVVVHGVSRQLRLRRGQEVLCLYNEAYEPYGTRPATATAAPDVMRTETAPGHD